MKLYLQLSIIFIITLFFAGCSTIKPEVMKKHLTIEKPEKVKSKMPVVFYFQGSGGWNGNAYTWSKWFKEHGVAAVMIGNAQVRSYDRLYGIDYEADLSSALEAVKDDPSLDLAKYAVMGFSRGGTMAMKSNTYLKEDQLRPDFIFALYPGDSRGCPSSFSKDDGTDVHIFYGDSDDWGDYKGIRNRCKSTADWYSNVYFHLLKGAEHGYDGDYYNEWKCCGGRTFVSQPNKEAVNETKKVILELIKKEWNLKKIDK